MNGGRILWNVTAISERFMISCLMGRHPMKGGSECSLTGQVIPFGAMVEYHPVSAKDQSRLHQFGAKVLPGIFLGYALYAGGIWKGYIIVAEDIDELEGMDSSELHAIRLNAKEVLTPQRSGNFIFPVADGTVRFFGQEQRLRTSTLTRRPERGQEQKILQGKSDESHSPTQLQDDSTRDDEEAESDFWTITGEFIYRHHIVPRVKLYVPKEESFPIPLEYIEITRTTHTSLDALLEKHIEDYWNVDGEKDLSDDMDRIHKICSTEGKATRRIFMVRVETYKETKNFSS